MKINDPGIPGGENNIANASKANRSAALEKLGHSGAYGQTAGSSPAGSDEVSISPLAQALQSLRSDSPERQARLEEIARHVDNGTYHVDAGALSRSLIQNATSKDELIPAAPASTDVSS
jgi:flagellar biosynthesis anti-sigma factor FlgM